MAKFVKVTQLCEIVTEEGSIELNDQQMKEISNILAPKMH